MEHHNEKSNKTEDVPKRVQ